MKNQKTIDDLLARHARPHSGTRGIEHYNLRGLAGRLGVGESDVIQLAEDGMLNPVGHRRHSVVGEVFAFPSDVLNDLRLGILVSFLEALAEALQPGDDDESESRFVTAATILLRQARQERSEGSSASQRKPDKGVKKFAAALAAGHGKRIHTLAVGESRTVRQIGQRLAGLAPASTDHHFNGEVLTGKIARDRYVKKIKDEDEDRRDANAARAALGGAAAGALLPGRKARPLVRAGIGAATGVAGVLGVRAATNGTKDLYGDRTREAKRAEGLPALALTGAAGLAVAARLRAILKARRRVGFSTADRAFIVRLARQVDPHGREFARHLAGDAQIELAAGQILGMLGKIGRGIGRKALPLAGAGALVGGGVAATDGDEETGPVGGAIGGALGTAVGAIGTSLALRGIGRLGAFVRRRPGKPFGPSMKPAIARLIS